MKRIQKTAWICVICMLLAIVVALTILVIHFLTGAPDIIFAVIIPCCMGPALAVEMSLFVPIDKGKVVQDERDIMIRKNAATAGFVGAFLFTCAACMIPFFVLGPDALIEVKWLPQIWIGTFISQFFFYSLAIVAEYGFGGKENE